MEAGLLLWELRRFQPVGCPLQPSHPRARVTRHLLRCVLSGLFQVQPAHALRLRLQSKGSSGAVGDGALKACVVSSQTGSSSVTPAPVFRGKTAKPWKCDRCGFIVEGTSRQITLRKFRRIQRSHPSVAGKRLLIDVVGQTLLKRSPDMAACQESGSVDFAVVASQLLLMIQSALDPFGIIWILIMKELRFRRAMLLACKRLVVYLMDAGLLKAMLDL